MRRRASSIAASETLAARLEARSFRVSLRDNALVVTNPLIESLNTNSPGSRSLPVSKGQRAGVSAACNQWRLASETR